MLKMGDGQMLYQEMQTVRGYMSSIEPVLHFGLDSVSTVEEVRVIWPDGRENLLKDVAANQVLNIRYSEAKVGADSLAILDLGMTGVMLREVSAELGVDFVHQEEDKIDYNIQRTLPHKLSQFGPALAVGDLNGDGLEDLVVGSASGFAPVWYAQNKTEVLSKKNCFPVKIQFSRRQGS